MGSPSDLECLAVALDDGTDESPVWTTTTLWFPPSTEPATTTTLDPAVVAEQERIEAERQRAEEERQAAIDACWAAHDAEWAAWDEAYNAWGEETDGQGDYEAWLEDHPQPVTPDCGE